MRFLGKFHVFLATLGPVGFIPYAPGTFGTAVAFLLVILLRPGDLVLSVVLLLAVPVGIVVCDNAEKYFGRDSQYIVVDEFCGYLISVIFLPKTSLILCVSFILFRFFDIVKPLPIGRLEERIQGGVGVMTDDLAAGVYTNIILQISTRLL